GKGLVGDRRGRRRRRARTAGLRLARRLLRILERPGLDQDQVRADLGGEGLKPHEQHRYLAGGRELGFDVLKVVLNLLDPPVQFLLARRLGLQPRQVGVRRLQLLGHLADLPGLRRVDIKVEDDEQRHHSEPPHDELVARRQRLHCTSPVFCTTSRVGWVPPGGALGMPEAPPGEVTASPGREVDPPALIGTSSPVTWNLTTSRSPIFSFCVDVRSMLRNLSESLRATMKRATDLYVNVYPSKTTPRAPDVAKSISQTSCGITVRSARSESVAGSCLDRSA